MIAPMSGSQHGNLEAALQGLCAWQRLQSAAHLTESGGQVI